MVLPSRDIALPFCAAVRVALLARCAGPNSAYVSRSARIDELIRNEKDEECHYRYIRADVKSETKARDDSASLIKYLEEGCPDLAAALLAPDGSDDRDTSPAARGSSENRIVAERTGSGDDRDGRSGGSGGSDGGGSSSGGSDSGRSSTSNRSSDSGGRESNDRSSRNNGGGNGSKGISPGRRKGANDDEK